MSLRNFLIALLLVSVDASTSAAPQKPTFTVSIPEPVVVATKAPTKVKKDRIISTKKAVASSLVLALNSGFLNGCCLSGAAAMDGTKQAVAAVTGAYTMSAVGMATSNTALAAMQLKVLASYIGGSLLASLMNPDPKAFVLSKSAGPALLLGSALIFASKFSFSNKANVLAFCLAAAANGLQNSITSVHTANLCRTAHYSGISSDMGTFLGQVLRGNKANLTKLKVFAGLAACFWLGGFASVAVTNKFAENSLLISAYFYLMTGLYFLGK